MGSNVSRHSGRGLSGRRTQSSGNLCNGAKLLGPSVNKILGSCGGRRVSSKDRNKFCGSLPNKLDERENRGGERTPESLSSDSNGDVYLRRTDSQNMEFLFQKIAQVRRGKDTPPRDPGYASEKSLEEEHPPRLPGAESPSSTGDWSDYTFITKENTFEARLEKDSRGLGLSVTGGIDTEEKFPGLIRIKRLFPNQPAWESKLLQIGDVILAANGVPLTGLTNHEALEVLRMTPNEVILNLCRPPRNILSMPLPSSCEPPPPPRRDPAHVVTSSQNADCMLLHPHRAASSNEFEIVLRKINGSLGFMLRKEDGSVLGHCVRALVREPALSDGRIRPGDKIVMVNNVDISPLSHEEAVMYLRQCGNEVRLRLYRDPAQTPVSALSPAESCKAFRPKPALRKEAMDMLCDLAVKKMSPTDSSSSGSKNRLRGTSPSSSPRRRKPKKTPSDEKPERPSYLGPRSEPKRVNYLEMEREEGKDSIITVTSTSDILRLAIGSATKVCSSRCDCHNRMHLEPSSMPPMSTSSSGFSYKNPAYQSAHPAVYSDTESADERLSDRYVPRGRFGDGGGPRGLIKWKGVLFITEDGDPDEGYEVFTVELCRGWSTRLGFSLQSYGNATCVSAVYADSVAAKDGRLRLGDELIKINDQTTEGMTTAEAIAILRRARGVVALTMRRKRETRS